MALPSADVSADDGGILIVSGLHDTEDGIKLMVEGDTHPRVHLTPQGDVLQGDGTSAPLAVGGDVLDIDLVMAVSATDGTSTDFDFLTQSTTASASGNIPAGFASVGSFDSVAGAEAALSGAGFSGTITVAVPGDSTGHAGFYQVQADGLDDPWVKLNAKWGVRADSGSEIAFFDNGVITDQLRGLYSPYNGTGLLGPDGTTSSTVETALDGVEGILDRWRFVGAISTSNQASLSTWLAGAVATQPTLDDSVQPDDGDDVWLFGQSTVSENGCYNLDASTGQWTKYSHPDVFGQPGNGYRVTLNASGNSADGKTYMFLDNDTTVHTRGVASEETLDGRWILIVDPPV